MSGISKQDLHGVRTASDLERKYQFGKSFAEIMGIAKDAQSAAASASKGVDDLDKSLTHDEIFNRLTNNGEIQGIYRENGEIYVNASYIKSGQLLADLVTAGVLKSKDGQAFYLDLDKGILRARFDELTISGQTAATQEDLEEYAQSVTESLNNIQNQIDGQIYSWFYDYVPTASNYPASEWTTDALKNEHVGDLFYVVDNEESGGLVYRWVYTNGTYSWVIVEDTDVAKAMAAAAQAQDTADGKRRVFVAKPYPPYDVGDLWTDGADLKVCKTAKASGSYSASDWVLATDYINSDKAEEIAQNKVDAQTQTDIFNKLTDNGALQGLFMQDGDMYINATFIKTGILLANLIKAGVLQSNDGETFYLDLDKGVLKAKFDELTISGKSAVTEDEFEMFSQTTESSITKAQNTADTAKSSAASAQSTANTAQNTAAVKRRVFVSKPTPPYDKGDLWAQGSGGDIMVCNVSRSSGSYTASDWVLASDYIDSAKAGTIAQGKVDAQTQAFIFNKLTNNGKMQGLFMQDGDLYINASYLKSGILDASLIDVKNLNASNITSGTLKATLIDVANLVAQKLLSTANGSSLSVDGAELKYLYNNLLTIELNNGSDGLPIMYMYDRATSRKHQSQFSPHHMQLGGTALAPVFGIHCLNGSPILQYGDIEGALLGDHIVDSGWSINFSYIKYASGYAVGWGQAQFEGVAVTTAFGSLYESEGMTIKFPSAVNNAPYWCDLSVQDSSLGVMLEVRDPVTATTSQKFFLVRGKSTASVDAIIGYRVAWYWR